MPRPAVESQGVSSYRAARGAAVTLAGQGVRFGLQVVGTIVLARLVSPRDFGLFAMVAAIFGIALVFGDFGLSTATVQAKAVSGTQRSNVFWLNLVIGLLLAVVLFAAASLIADAYHQPSLVPIVKVMCVVLPLSAASAQFRAEATREMKFGRLAVTDTVAQGAGVATGILVATQGGGYWSLITQQIVAGAVTLIGLIVASGWWPSIPGAAPMRRLLSFGSHNVGVVIVNYVCSNVDTILVGRNWGAGAAGFYNKAFQLVMLPLSQILGPMDQVALPILSRIEGASLFDDYAERALLVVGYGAIGVLACLGALAYPLIELALGPRWLPTAPILIVMTIGGCFEVVTYPYSWFCLARGRADLLLRATLMVRPVMIVLIVVGVTFSTLGAAVGVSVGFVINWAFLTMAMLPRLGMSRKKIANIAVRPLTLFGCTLALISPVSWMGKVWSAPLLQAAVTAAGMTLFLLLATVAIRPVRKDLQSVVATVLLIRRAPVS